jgi:ankyrin repeat protein
MHRGYRGEWEAAGPGGDDMMMAAGSGKDDAEGVLKLLSEGVDVNVRDESGCTGIYSASMSGRVRTVTAFVAAGADVNQGQVLRRMGYVFCPLYGASNHGSVEVVQVSLSKCGSARPCRIKQQHTAVHQKMTVILLLIFVRTVYLLYEHILLARPLSSSCSSPPLHLALPL